MRLSTVVRSIGLTVSNAVRVGLDQGAIPDPPLRLTGRVGRGDYRAVGEDLRRVVVDLGGLHPDDRLLDIGCGVGRLAAPLTRYLTAAGSYDGFDIDADLIAWCRDQITRRYPRFRFRHVDVASGVYNPKGAVDGAAFAFPYDDAAFSFVVATSLFTHLLTADAENYLRQIGRVLAPGGTMVATFFLLDDESRRSITEGTAQRRFAAGPGAADADAGAAGVAGADRADRAAVHRLLKSHQPEAAVAYPADWVRARLEALGLGAGIRRAGGWCGRPNPCTYQDVVIARKA